MLQLRWKPSHFPLVPPRSRRPCTTLVVSLSVNSSDVCISGRIQERQECSYFFYPKKTNWDVGNAKSIGHLLRQCQWSLHELGDRSGLFGKKQTCLRLSVVRSSVFTLVKTAYPAPSQVLHQYSFVNGFTINTKFYHYF